MFRVQFLPGLIGLTGFTGLTGRRPEKRQFKRIMFSFLDTTVIVSNLHIDFRKLDKSCSRDHPDQ